MGIIAHTHEFAKIKLNWLVLLTYLEQSWYIVSTLLSIAEKQIFSSLKQKCIICLHESGIWKPLSWEILL